MIESPRLTRIYLKKVYLVKVSIRSGSQVFVRLQYILASQNPLFLDTPTVTRLPKAGELDEKALRRGGDVAEGSVRRPAESP
jgi:hypothetical protein